MAESKQHPFDCDALLPLPSSLACGFCLPTRLAIAFRTVFSAPPILHWAFAFHPLILQPSFGGSSAYVTSSASSDAPAKALSFFLSIFPTAPDGSRPPDPCLQTCQSLVPAVARFSFALFCFLFKLHPAPFFQPTSPSQPLDLFLLLRLPLFSSARRG